MDPADGSCPRSRTLAGMDLRRTDPPPALLALGKAYQRECRGRRTHPVVLRLGALGGEHVVVPHGSATDAGLRADLLERVLDDLDPAVVLPWFTRGGALAPNDTDFAWYAAARTAFGRHGHPLRAFYVLTRTGWLDLCSDRSTPWRPPRT